MTCGAPDACAPQCSRQEGERQKVGNLGPQCMGGYTPLSAPIGSVQQQLSSKRLLQPAGALETTILHPLQHPKQLGFGFSKVQACSRSWQWGGCC
jgi:hypothetical protein